MDEKYRKLLSIPQSRLQAINNVILDPKSEVMRAFLAVVDKYGTPDEINRKHLASRALPNLLRKVEAVRPEHLKDLEWLQQQVATGRFISVRTTADKSSDPVQMIEGSPTSMPSPLRCLRCNTSTGSARWSSMPSSTRA